MKQTLKQHETNNDLFSFILVDNWYSIGQDIYYIEYLNCLICCIVTKCKLYYHPTLWISGKLILDNKCIVKVLHKFPWLKFVSWYKNFTLYSLKKNYIIILSFCEFWHHSIIMYSVKNVYLLWFFLLKILHLKVKLLT